MAYVKPPRLRPAARGAPALADPELLRSQRHLTSLTDRASECEEGTHAYAVGCAPITPEPSCDEPNPVKIIGAKEVSHQSYGHKHTRLFYAKSMANKHNGLREYSDDADLKRLREYTDDADLKRLRKYSDDADLKRLREYPDDADLKRLREYTDDADLKRLRKYSDDADLKRLREYSDDADLKRLRNVNK
ncbi:hypothetical protein evm_006819 [Chilo suppressalis]|nr:hypothetical protein evm_006819 [Chilo suppressalis]